mgnify:FL=1
MMRDETVVRPVPFRASSVRRMGNARRLLREKTVLEDEVRAGRLKPSLQAGLRRQAARAGLRASRLLRDLAA